MKHQIMTNIKKIYLSFFNCLIFFLYNLRKNQTKQRQNQAARKIQHFIRQSKNGYVKSLNLYAIEEILFYYVIKNIILLFVYLVDTVLYETK